MQKVRTSVIPQKEGEMCSVRLRKDEEDEKLQLAGEEFQAQAEEADTQAEKTQT